MGLYDVNGRIYDALVYSLTFGAEEKLKARTISHLDLQPGAVVMDWGCGTGLSTREIQRQMQDGRIYAIDRSSALLQRAVSRLENREHLAMHFVLADGLAITLPERADAAVTSYSLSTLGPERLEAALQVLWHNLRDDGRLAIIETRVLAPRNRLERAYQWLYAMVVRNIFADESTEDLLPTVERYFELMHVEADLSLNSIAFVGKRRKSILAAPASGDRRIVA